MTEYLIYSNDFEKDFNAVNEIINNKKIFES